MLQTKERLKEFRVKNTASLTEGESVVDEGEAESITDPNPPTANSTGILSLLDIDLLDSAPFRLWRRCYENDSRKTLATTLIAYVLGQLYFFWMEFGAVFFVFSLLCAICLSLGKRNDNEISAYSVFNPNCERLLGQMTAEHFERDLLKKRR
ncbi:unnamed protein product [Auanema sp. JU1783]|nr:unnamed protein product [Auanema sp. JU1783]